MELLQALKEETREKYRRLGISDTIFNDTMSDIDIWRENCRRQKGIDGLAEYQWLYLHMELKIFRLGRLQFQPIPYGDEVALNVHIPQGEPLSYEAVWDSYRQAYVFFHGMTDLFVCTSWLLSPALGEILPESSNIIRFQKDYHITALEPDSRQCEKRVFGKLSDNFESYPEKSSLQRGVRQYLLQGGKVGEAEGIFRLCEHCRLKEEK